VSQVAIQPAWFRVTRWIDVLAVLLMVASGWQINDPSPTFPALRFPLLCALIGGHDTAHIVYLVALSMLIVLFIAHIVHIAIVTLVPCSPPLIIRGQ
jgi:thiosulfate reductase cytochrome b subunit